MSVPVKLAAFALLLSAVFGIGFGIGAAAGPEPTQRPQHAEHSP